MPCPSCGQGTSETLCAYHAAGGWKDTWAAENRVICDLIHRGTEPARLSAEERGDVMQVDQQGWCG